MRNTNAEPQRIHVVSPDGRIIAARIHEGLTSRYVDESGRLRPEADAQGFRLLASFAKEKPGFIAAYKAFEEAAERGETKENVPADWLPPSILKLRAKALKTWTWPTPPAAKAKP